MDLTSILMYHNTMQLLRVNFVFIINLGENNTSILHCNQLPNKSSKSKAVSSVIMLCSLIMFYCNFFSRNSDMLLFSAKATLHASSVLLFIVVRENVKSPISQNFVFDIQSWPRIYTYIYSKKGRTLKLLIFVSRFCYIMSVSTTAHWIAWQPVKWPIISPKYVH